MKIINRICLTVIIVSIICLCAVSCSDPLGGREYRDDLYVEVDGMEGQLLIKEWSFLLGSGAEIYYVDPVENKPQLLGKVQGGDDGFCPFANGKYSVEYKEGEITVSWSFDGSDNYSKSANFIVSGQLEGETYAMAFGNIYTFRAEN